MPKVPVSKKPTELAPVRGGGVPVSVADTGLRKTTSALDSLATEIYEDEKVKADKRQLSEFSRQVMGIEEGMYKPGGAFDRPGRLAVNVTQETLEDMDSQVEAIKKDLSSERVKGYADEVYAKDRERVSLSLTKYEFNQSRLADDEEHTDSMTALVNNGSLADDNLVPALETVKVRTQAHLTERGKPQATIDKKVQALQSSMIISAIERKRANGEDLDAEALFKDKAVQKILSTDQKNNLKPKIEQSSFLVKAQTTTNDIMLDGGTSAEQIARARKLGGKLQDEVVKRLKVRHNDLKAQEVENQRVIGEQMWQTLEDMRANGSPVAEMQAVIDHAPNRKTQGQMETWLKLPQKELKDEQKIEQTVRYEQLRGLPIEQLREQDLDTMVRTGEISRVGFTALNNLKDPRKSAQAKLATKRINDAKTKKLFDSEDPAMNSKRWAENSELLQDYITNHPEGDYNAFVDEIMKPIDEEWKEWFSDLWHTGTPGLEAARLRKEQVLGERAGRKTELKVGTVENGYRYTGGDKTKLENWEKVK